MLVCRSNAQCAQQYTKGFRVTASEAQSFFRRRYSRLRDYQYRRKDGMEEDGKATKGVFGSKFVDSRKTVFGEVTSSRIPSLYTLLGET